MTYAALLLFGIAFLELFLLFGIVETARSILARSRESMGVLMDPEMDDEQKEVHMRRGSLALFKATGAFSLKFLAVFAILYAVFLALVIAIPSLEEPLLRSFVSPVTIVALTLAVMFYAWVRNVVRKQLQPD